MCEFYLILNPGMNIGSMGMNKINKMFKGVMKIANGDEIWLLATAMDDIRLRQRQYQCNRALENYGDLILIGIPDKEHSSVI